MSCIWLMWLCFSPLVCESSRSLQLVKVSVFPSGFGTTCNNYSGSEQRWLILIDRDWLFYVQEGKVLMMYQRWCLCGFLSVDDGLLGEDWRRMAVVGGDAIVVMVWHMMRALPSSTASYMKERTRVTRHWKLGWVTRYKWTVVALLWMGKEH